MFFVHNQKIIIMKSIFIPALFIAMALNCNSQSSAAEILQNLEQATASQQSNNQTATMKSASRLFGAKDDLTTVILIIPSGSIVTVYDADSTYYHVGYEDLDGYVFKRHATINDTPPAYQAQNTEEQEPVVQEQPAPVQQISRFSYLENKYGSNMAARLIAGKIWKGMNSEMVKDSWGEAQKKNRVVSGNTIKEEWIYSNTWLYFENNTLVEWGAIRR
jgi:hypothetical protein